MLVDGGMWVCVEEVVVGILFFVKIGEVILIDGEVLLGWGLVDESSLIGELVLVEKEMEVFVWVGIMILLGLC